MIRELKTFVAVAREGTFAAAGQQIGLTQAAVSAQMKRLEDELGFTLFDRTGRAARLNRRGRQTPAISTRRSSSARPSRCTATCAGRRWRASPFACWCHAPRRRATGAR